MTIDLCCGRSFQSGGYTEPGAEAPRQRPLLLSILRLHDQNRFPLPYSLHAAPERAAFRVFSLSYQEQLALGYQQTYTDAGGERRPLASRCQVCVHQRGRTQRLQQVSLLHQRGKLGGKHSGALRAMTTVLILFVVDKCAIHRASGSGFGISMFILYRNGWRLILHFSLYSFLLLIRAQLVVSISKPRMIKVRRA